MPFEIPSQLNFSVNNFYLPIALRFIHPILILSRLRDIKLKMDIIKKKDKTDIIL